jgi:hypothetical protein
MTVKQVGGDHYAAEFQHWDWVAITGLDYFLGNATKYICRYTKKGKPEEDLDKALSYIDKGIEVYAGRDRAVPLTVPRSQRITHDFAEYAGLNFDQRQACLMAVTNSPQGRFRVLRAHVAKMRAGLPSAA